MPKQITDIRDFLQKARRKDARSVKIKKTDKVVKFKIRCSKVTIHADDGRENRRAVCLVLVHLVRDRYRKGRQVDPIAPPWSSTQGHLNLANGSFGNSIVA
ncbi:60S ribosomal protein L38 [Aphanomyces euteiches]|uniref:60S ribosomal protein L38 n=1 Tax=Aphanomyces euteiches TaxID=100861 RepID=A0A6G0XT95_9STRA|nr:hypothetical protein Ae201684_001502 [Aphanomyces euteiches]KAH9075218.1 60S ribosomal protein L38 [Aphanomyces euteiches]